MLGVTAAPVRDFVVDIEGVYGAFLSAHNAAAMITRPDIYVFGGVADRRRLADLVDEFLATLASNGFNALSPAVSA